MDHLAPFPFPAGVLTTMDTAATDTGIPECHHAIIIPAGGFSAPHFDIPALNYCSEVIPLGCASGGADGKGNLWDASGSVPAMANVTKQADTSDGVCDSSFTGANCNTSPGGAGANTLGRIVTTRSASTTSGNRGTVDVPLRSLTWSDSVCAPAFDPGCCITSTYGDDTVANGEMKISEFDFIVSGTTDKATASFADLNGDGCKRSGVGFTNPGPDGPKRLTGVAAAGPCCTVGRSTTFVALGVGFTGGPPLFDVGFQMTSPNTIAACGAPSAGSCVLTTDPCLGSPSGAFVDLGR
jgi:hypothetical protein